MLNVGEKHAGGAVWHLIEAHEPAIAIAVYELDVAGAVSDVKRCHFLLPSLHSPAASDPTAGTTEPHRPGSDL